MEFIISQLSNDGLLIILALIVVLMIGNISISLAKIANK